MDTSQRHVIDPAEAERRARLQQEACALLDAMAPLVRDLAGLNERLTQLHERHNSTGTVTLPWPLPQGLLRTFLRQLP